MCDSNPYEPVKCLGEDHGPPTSNLGNPLDALLGIFVTRPAAIFVGEVLLFVGLLPTLNG